jgi:hypothetical protein
MADVHPSCIFHFTSGVDTLLSILSGSFRVSYAREKIIGKRKSIKFAVPMVSFCDIKLSDIQTHISSYGSYGIGMTKEWAFRNGLNPVMYVSKNAEMSADMIAQVKRAINYRKETEDAQAREYAGQFLTHSINTLRYVKNYHGDRVRKTGETTRDYPFANEREWRYVPEMNKTERPVLAFHEIDTDELKASWNAKLSGLSLRFDPLDVKYIIIGSDKHEERQTVIDKLGQYYGSASGMVAQHLASRILSVEQIANDI